MSNVKNLRKPIVEQAIEVAELGLKVLPATGKQCHLKKWQERCSSDPDEIRKLFEEQPDATNVAVVCGQSGLFVIDIDVNKDQETGPDGLDWYAKHEHELPLTRVHKTPSGGFHRIYWMPKGNPLGNVEIAHKVDSRGMSGYIIWPTQGSGYEVVEDRKVAKLPKDFTKLMVKRGNEMSEMSVKDLENAIILDTTGFSLHGLSTQLIYRLIAEGLEVADVMARVRAVMDQSEAKKTRHADWQARYNDIPRSVEGAINRHKKVMRDMDELDARFEKKREHHPQFEGFFNIDALRLDPPKPVIGDEINDMMFRGIPPNLLFEPTPWVIPGFLERGSITGIAGTSNVGKTRAIVSVALAVTSGQPYTGLEVTDPGNVMIISREERDIKLKKRLVATMMRAKKKKLKHGIFIAASEVSQDLTLLLGDREGVHVMDKVVEAIVEKALEIEAKLIIFDPLVSFSSGVNENSADMDKLLAVMRHIAEETGAAILFIHHTPKGGSQHADWYIGSLEAFRGSSAIGASLDYGFTLTRLGTLADAAAAETLGEAVCKRWLRLRQCKGRETLHDTEGLFYLHSQQIPVGDDWEEVGVLDVKKPIHLQEAILDAEELGPDYKELVIRAIRHMGRTEFKQSDLHKAMRDVQTEPILQTKRLTTTVIAKIAKVFPVELDGMTYKYVAKQMIKASKLG